MAHFVRVVILVGIGLVGFPCLALSQQAQNSWRTDVASLEEIDDEPNNPFVPDWLENFKPRPPKLDIPTPVEVWHKVNSGTRAVWNGGRRVVMAPWNLLTGSDDRQSSASRGVRRTASKPRREKAESLTDWLAQPRPGF